ncbi:excalibur calcium-binding domain-containing protein [Streptomyces sp. NPDC006551]|uniref:excalibur calcium-binding domain-containing protein n=1 Tax=Streptomyces sp. NPDC006551 TaxID=3157178 RepID=UPI0033B6009A
MYPPSHLPPATSAPARRWWQHPALIITALVVLPPVGIALAWLGRWSGTKKIIATVLAGLWFLAPFLGDPPKKTEADAKPAARPTVARTAATTPPPPSPSPSPSTKAPRDAQMPHVVGDTYDDAMEALKKAGIDKGDVTLDDVYLDIDAPTHTEAAEDGDWKICFQTPDKGAAVASGTTVRLDLGQWSDADLVQKCPGAKGTTYKIPANDPDYRRDDTADTTGGGSSSGGADSVYYKNCSAAKAAGAAPIRSGEPGYRKALDRDGDGVACDK